MKYIYLKLSFIVVIATTFSSCSLAFLASGNQKINIVRSDSTTLTYDKTKIESKENTVTIIKDHTPHQFKIERPGYKNEYRVCYPNRLGPLGYATIAWDLGLTVVFTNYAIGMIPADFAGFDILAGTMCGVFGSVATLGLGLNSPKLFDYNKEIKFNQVTKIPSKDSIRVALYLDNVSFDVKPENIINSRISYYNYSINKLQGRELKIKKESGIKDESDILKAELNKCLAKSSFLDTSGNVLTKNYKMNYKINATVIEQKFNFMHPVIGISKNTYKDGFITFDLKVKWELKDIYNNACFSDTINCKSGEFVSFLERANSNYETDAMKDALEEGMYKFMNSTKFSNKIKEISIQNETMQNKVDSLIIPLSSSYVSNMEDAIKSTVTIISKSKFGSGFFVSSNGYILTNYHVIADTADLKVGFADGTKLPAKVVSVSKIADVAVIKVEKGEYLPFKLVNAKNYKLGKDIFVIGTPSAQDLSQTVSKGIISAVRNVEGGMKLIQTDAAINKGNSGGPMIDKEGNLIGIVNSKLIGEGIEGVAFSIPSAVFFKYLNIICK